MLTVILFDLGFNGTKGTQGRRKEFFKRGGVVLNVNFQKCSLCTDLFTS